MEIRKFEKFQMNDANIYHVPLELEPERAAKARRAVVASLIENASKIWYKGMNNIGDIVCGVSLKQSTHAYLIFDAI